MHSQSEEEHVEYLSIVLGILKQKQLYAKFKKCEFCLENVYFLRHVISKEGVSVDLGKIKAVVDWLRPKAMLDIRSFLGLGGTTEDL